MDEPLQQKATTPEGRLKLSRALPATLIVLLVLAAAFYWKAQSNFQRQDYVNSNFFSFWLSGHMVWTGESPYDPAQFLAGFEDYGATYRPSKILQYPLPLMYFLAPVGLLPPGTGYLAWQLIAETALAFACFVLLRRGPGLPWLPGLLALGLLFFGPVFLSLQVGSVGAIALVAVTMGILLLEKDKPFAAGLALSLTLLKPPQALTLMLLVGCWLLIRRQWPAIMGAAVGGLALVAVWAGRDPQWLAKFRGSSDFLLGHTMGVQSNVFSLSFRACGGSVSCMWSLGAVAAAAILLLGAWLLWRNRSRWTDWEAFSLIVPLGFVTAVYLWSYDQILYVVPVAHIVWRLFIQRQSYVPVVIFIAILDAVSFAALTVQAYTKQDLLSLATTLLVLGAFLWLQKGLQGHSIDKPMSPA